VLSDTQLQHAFQLASFLHRERRIALNIVVEAASRFNNSFSVQYKRLYYHTRGDSGPLTEQTPSRYKTILSDPVLVQQLVFAASGPYERCQEQMGDVNEADLLIRFIKHLIMISVARNSFHVAIGISRLLHNYTTPEASVIYQQLLPSSRAPRDESYWRVRKGRLIRELKERFGEELRVRRGNSGEDRFLTSSASTRSAAEVEYCLEVFKPWGTPCLSSSPLAIRPVSNRKQMLPLIHTDDPDQEHLAEEARMHALIHPPCFAHLVQTLGMPPPAFRLEVPLFLPKENKSSGGIFNRAPIKPTEDELRIIKQRINDLMAERDSASAIDKQ
jgi:hypothetical protein